MESDMRDEDLVFWTGRGESESGFFVAEVGGEPVATALWAKLLRKWEIGKFNKITSSPLIF